MNTARTAAVVLLLFICMITDLKKGKINVLFCLAVGILGIVFDVIEITEGKDALNYIISIVPGVAFLIMSQVTSGAIGLGDGIVLIAVGILTDIGQIICLLSVALLFSALTALVMMVFFHRNGKTGIPFVPFLFVGMLTCLI